MDRAGGALQSGDSRRKLIEWSHVMQESCSGEPPHILRAVCHTGAHSSVPVAAVVLSPGNPKAVVMGRKAPCWRLRRACDGGADRAWH